MVVVTTGSRKNKGSKDDLFVYLPRLTPNCFHLQVDTFSAYS
jgi:hypothetical protein